VQEAVSLAPDSYDRMLACPRDPGSGTLVSQVGERTFSSVIS
jgi:hypothetical protein